MLLIKDMENQLQKVINLAKKTGCRLIIFDSARPDAAVVVMPLDEYEKMTAKNDEVKNLTENELLDRINRDIAIWKNEQFLKEQRIRDDRDFFADNNKSDYIFKGRHVQDNPEKELDYLSAIPDFFIPAENKVQERQEKPKWHWQIPRNRKEAAEEVIEEDRQYLEEISL